MADWSLIVATAAAVGTVTLGVFQYRLSLRQTTLAERQAILEEARRLRESGAHLNIAPGMITGGSDGATYLVTVWNTGASAARGVYVAGYIHGEQASRSVQEQNINVGKTVYEFSLTFSREHLESIGGRTTCREPSTSRPSTRMGWSRPRGAPERWGAAGGAKPR